MTRSHSIIVALLLLVLAGCGIPGSEYDGSPMATSPPLRIESYVPTPTPASPTSTPYPTATPPSVATPVPTSGPERVVRGWGDFPLLAVPVLVSNDTNFALYLVEEDTASLLLNFDEVTSEPIHFYYDVRTHIQVSPDGQHVACLFDTFSGATILEVIDTRSGQHTTLAESPGDTAQMPGKTTGKLAPRSGRGKASEAITSFAWVDSEHVLYTKVRFPSSEEVEASRQAGELYPIRGELWLNSLDGGERTRLASNQISRVLGASPDGQRVHYLAFAANWESTDKEELFVLDLASGETLQWFPRKDHLGQRYVTFGVVVIPGQGQRILASEIGPGMTVHLQPPVIWMLDSMTEEAKMVWTVDQGKANGGSVTYYDCPRDYLWSPHLDSVFAYLADGAALGGVWKVDLGRGEATQFIHERNQVLVDWTLEGLVTQSFSSFDRLILWDEDGNIVGEITFAGEWLTNQSVYPLAGADLAILSGSEIG